MKARGLILLSLGIMALFAVGLSSRLIEGAVERSVCAVDRRRPAATTRPRLPAGIPLCPARDSPSRPRSGRKRHRGEVKIQCFEIKRQPNTLRVQVEVMAKGKDLKEALGKLKERREAVKQQLATLGATKDAIEFGEPSAGSGKTDRQRELERLVNERIRKTVKKDAKAKEAAPVVASVW